MLIKKTKQRTLQERNEAGRLRELFWSSEMVIIAYINDISFTAAVVLDESYKSAWFYKGWCEFELKEYE